MKAGIIGAGKIGLALAQILRNDNFELGLTARRHQTQLAEFAKTAGPGR